MDKDPPSTGPDVAVVGAARSGTTYLAAQLSAHPMIDAPAVKEPTFYSRYLDKGDAWYHDLFPARAPGHVRLDASVSYTFPHFPGALAALAKASPHAQIVYVVRDPIARALSHYQLHRYYFTNEPAATFGGGDREQPRLPRLQGLRALARADCRLLPRGAGPAGALPGDDR